MKKTFGLRGSNKLIVYCLLSIVYCLQHSAMSDWRYTNTHKILTQCWYSAGQSILSTALSYEWLEVHQHTQDLDPMLVQCWAGRIVYSIQLWVIGGTPTHTRSWPNAGTVLGRAYCLQHSVMSDWRYTNTHKTLTQCWDNAGQSVMSTALSYEWLEVHQHTQDLDPMLRQCWAERNVYSTQLWVIGGTPTHTRPWPNAGTVLASIKDGDPTVVQHRV